MGLCQESLLLMYGITSCTGTNASRGVQPFIAYQESTLQCLQAKGSTFQVIFVKVTQHACFSLVQDDFPRVTFVGQCSSE